MLNVQCVLHMCLRVKNIGKIKFILYSYAFIFYASICGEKKHGIGFSICTIAPFIILKSPHYYCSRRCKMSLFPVNNLLKHTYWTWFPSCKWGWKDFSERTSGIRCTSRRGGDFNPLIWNYHVCLHEEILFQWNMYMCVCVCV